MIKTKKAALASVKKKGTNLGKVSETLSDDKDVVMAAVKNHGIALQYASERLRDDTEVVYAAIADDEYFPYTATTIVQMNHLNRFGPSRAFQYASERIKKDKDIVKDALKISGAIYEFVATELKCDREYVLGLINSADTFIRGYDPTKGLMDILSSTASYRKDKEVLIAILNRFSTMLNDLPIWVLAMNPPTAIGNETTVFMLMSPKLKNDPDIVAAASKFHCRNDEEYDELYNRAVDELLKKHTENE